MGALRRGKNEVTYVDVTAPFRSLTFPFLELIIVTGVCWMGIGWLDVNELPGQAAAFLTDRQARDGLLGLWAILVVWRFVLPLLRARRKRFVVTNQRVIARAGRLGARTDSIPFHDIVGVRRRRGGISLAIRGYDRPLYFPELPKTKAVERAIDEQLANQRLPLWR